MEATSSSYHCSQLLFVDEHPIHINTNYCVFHTYQVLYQTPDVHVSLIFNPNTIPWYRYSCLLETVNLRHYQDIDHSATGYIGKQ